MKHLKSYKLFESVENLYHQINANQWNHYTSGGIDVGLPNDDPFYVENWDVITPKEFKLIEELLPEIKNSDWLEPDSLNNCRLDWSHQGLYITIIKLKDEWFYFAIDDDYYRCDGVEGVIELIKDLDLVKLNRREWPKPKLESNSAYQEITSEEYDRFTSGVSHPDYDNYEWDEEYTNYDESKYISDYWVNFTQKELDKIKELVPDAHFCRNIETDRNDARIDSEESGLIMIKLKDEWYYVLMDMSEQAQDNLYFKCDQFEGLIKLIHDYIL